MKPELDFSDRAWRIAYGVALRILKAPDQAEDAAQEAMLRAYRARDSFAGRARFESWLHRIAFTTALGFLRKPHYKRRIQAANSNIGPSELDLERFPSPDLSPEQDAQASELAEQLEGCLDNLRDLDRIAFTERFLRGTTERELGEILGVSTNAAKQRAFRARRAVRACVKAKRAGAAEC